MMKCASLCVIVIHLSECSVQYGVREDPGQPLFLTPYIEAGRIQEARTAALVDPLIEGLISYSGYLTVNKLYNSNTFFWYFPSEKSWTSKPVLLWLQGGPGTSSLLGLLFENGAITLTKTGIKKNIYSWSKDYNVIYLDNPVGTGFSFTNASDGYLRDQNSIGEAVYKALLQFFTIFPEIKKKPLFLTVESYAGKYIPAVALAIHENNQHSQLPINLQGLLIGNGMVDPINMLHYGEYLYQLGLLDINGKNLFQKYEIIISQYINSSQWNEATDVMSMLIMDYYYTGNSTLFSNLTGLTQHFNYINDKDGEYDLQPFTNNNTVRKAIHVGSTTFSDGKAVALALKEDIMKSMKSVVEMLLEHYDILFYNGQLDVICAYPLTEHVLQGFQWSGRDQFHQAKRRIWTVDDEVAGYCKSGGRLTEVLVRNAGHLVPANQPIWGLDLLNKFISGFKCL